MKVIYLKKCIKNSYVFYIAFFINLLYNDLCLIFKNSSSIIVIALLPLLLLFLSVANWLLGEKPDVYSFLSNLRWKVKLWGLWLARFHIDKTDNNINFCFIELAINKPGRMDANYIITLICGSIISNYFLLSSLFFASS